MPAFDVGGDQFADFAFTDFPHFVDPLDLVIRRGDTDMRVEAAAGSGD